MKSIPSLQRKGLLLLNDYGVVGLEVAKPWHLDGARPNIATLVDTTRAEAGLWAKAGEHQIAHIITFQA